MRTEHLQNVHPGWVVAGWLVAIAVTSLVLLVAAGLTNPGAEGLGDAWTIAGVVIGFFIGGMFMGFKSMRAPILHGIALGIVTLVVWLVLNIVVTLFFADEAWRALTPLVTAAVLLLQMAAAVLGAWTGHVVAMRGGPDLTD